MKTNAKLFWKLLHGCWKSHGTVFHFYSPPFSVLSLPICLLLSPFLVLCLSVSLSLFLSLSISLSPSLCVSLPPPLSVSLCLYMCVCLSVFLSLCLSLCLYVSLFVCLSVCLFLSLFMKCYCRLHKCFEILLSRLRLEQSYYNKLMCKR